MTNQKVFGICAAAVSLIGAALVLSGCGITDQLSQKAGEKIIEKTIESQTGGKANIDYSNNQLNIQTEQGQMSMSSEGTGKLPDNFPANMFIFSDAKIMLSLSGAKGTNNYSVTYGTNSSVADAISKYKQEMASAGWTKESELNIDTNGSTMLTFKKGSDNIAITVGKNSENEKIGATAISITATADGSNAGDTSAPTQEQ
jgi:hypothetical protein